VHELSIALHIAELAVERAGDATPCRVVVEIGELAAVMPDALRFAWDALTAHSTLEGCTLDIVQTPGNELTIRQLEVSHGA
jgi:hydrogenase nickel incorporation protein HypA/HybF